MVNIIFIFQNGAAIYGGSVLFEYKQNTGEYHLYSPVLVIHT